MAENFSLKGVKVRTVKEPGHPDEIFMTHNDVKYPAFYVDEGKGPESGVFDIAFTPNKSAAAAEEKKKAEASGGGDGAGAAQ